MSGSIPKTSWADDVDELEQPKGEDYVDENGVRTTVEYTVNDEGKKVKITKKVKRVLQKSLVNHNVAERQHWTKFGKEKGNKAGPDRATTTVGEAVMLKLSAGNKSSEPEPSAEQTMKTNLARADTPPFGGDDTGTPAEPAAAVPAATSGGKYVPPSMRGARGPGEAMSRPGGSRDDLPTLRVTNISEDTQENDLRDLFSAFGRVARVYVGRDRETGAGKGFAFVSFEDKSTAQKAMEKMHGRGYDNLILNIQWSQPREQR
ncbi:hypothetical protein NLI96_g5059 [Meripilus lineatus]|uniref:Eukaryotic translation initiation factor 3 subunit G n=1 Tax=Meripilus lineatus TaxID=2056292 RepID=A0AAD5V8Z6_9APHY|nr:hypothetical protein NLI96_g5059 [Physisporinus lineatus]